MNRTDRLLAIVLELQARKQIRAEDLAAIFEVTKRTIYRDMQALSESGVPIVSMPGHGYSLVEGYFLPPLTFTADEAIMLRLGSDFIAGNFDAQYRDAAQSAGHKIVAVLPDKLRTEVDYLESSIRFFAFNELSVPETLQHLRRAIIQRRTVRFGYSPRYGDGSAPDVREADPYALIHIGGAWMLIAWCHLRHDIRHFRLHRMDALTLLNKTFNRPPDFKIQLGDESDRTSIVRLLFDHHAAPRVLESPSSYQIAQESHPEGLLITLTVRHPDDILNWVLSWGSNVRVLEPASLQESLTREARAILSNHP